MKKIRMILFLLVFPAAVGAQQAPKTVTDFFLLLPGNSNAVAGTRNPDESYFENGFFFYLSERSNSEAAIIKYRRSVIKTEDLKNGYLKLEADDWDGWAEIALFKKADGSYLVALSQIDYMGPGSAGDIMILSLERGQWTDVTKSVFPGNPFSGIAYFKLPRVGTTIALTCSDERGDESKPECQAGETLAEYLWDKTKFVKRSKAK